MAKFIILSLAELSKKIGSLEVADALKLAP